MSSPQKKKDKCNNTVDLTLDQDPVLVDAMYNDSDQETWQLQVLTTTTLKVMLINEEVVAGAVQDAKYGTGEGKEDKNSHDIDDKNKQPMKVKSTVLAAIDSQGAIKRNTNGPNGTHQNKVPTRLWYQDHLSPL
jgi:hypothetical protein